jgi:hypothetical protein
MISLKTIFSLISFLDFKTICNKMKTAIRTSAIKTKAKPTKAKIDGLPKRNPGFAKYYVTITDDLFEEDLKL